MQESFDCDELAPYGWDQGWAAAFAAAAPGSQDSVPARVIRHDGVALTVVTPAGLAQVPMRLREPVAVGDWVVVERAAIGAGLVSAVLPRRSLLRRRDAERDAEQLLAANVDLVVIVCGLDRPVRDGRIQRSTLLAHDAGAMPLVVLSKADLVEDPDRVLVEVQGANPGVEVLVASAPLGLGIAELARRITGATAVLIGESGSGKSTLANLLVGAEVAATADVRPRDAKGRHTTTARELYLLPQGGVLVDSPGIRSIGTWGEPEVIFPDLVELAAGCRFSDCAHSGEPGCAVRRAVDEGQVAQSRLDAWHRLQDG